MAYAFASAKLDDFLLPDNQTFQEVEDTLHESYATKEESLFHAPEMDGMYSENPENVSLWMEQATTQFVRV